MLTKSLQTGEIIGGDDVRVVSRDANPGVGYFRNINDVVSIVNDFKNRNLQNDIVSDYLKLDEENSVKKCCECIIL